VKRVLIADLKPGMLVARTLFGDDGTALLPKNTELSEPDIGKLRQLGIGSIYIKDSFVDANIPEVVTINVLANLAQDLKTSLANLSAEKTVDINTLKMGASQLVDDIGKNRHLLPNLEDIHTYDDYLFFHSINVAILSVMTGISLGLHKGDMADLALGSLLHDIGMIMIDPAILNNQEKLTPQQIAEIQKHPEIGFNILHNGYEVSATAAHIAYQHHERFDGSGYPRGLREKQILEHARIAAVADTYHAIITDHPYRRAYSSSEAVMIIKKLTGTHFDPDVVEAFLSNIAPYPEGSMVLLNTGNIAQVTMVDRLRPDTPVIQLICDQNGQILKEKFEIDLRQRSEVAIARPLTKNESDLISRRIKPLNT